MECRHRSGETCVSVHVHARRTYARNAHQRAHEPSPPPGQFRVGRMVQAAGTRTV